MGASDDRTESRPGGDRLVGLTIVWHKREYRAFLLIMVLLSLATSTTLPLVTLYLVDRFHVSLSLVGVYFIGEALLGLLLGLVVGRWSDSWPSRLPAMRLAATWVAIGWLVFALSPYVWLSLSMGLVFVSAGAITMGQAFAALHDVMTRDAERRPGFVNAAIRSAFSLGFVLGPVLGAELATLLSFRAAFVVAGGLNLLCLVPMAGLEVPVATDRARAPSRRGHAPNNAPLYVFVGLCTVVLIGTALRITYLPIDVTQHLGGSLRQYGTVMAISPFAELITLPAAGLLALRFGIGRIFSLGLAVATIEYLILSLNAALWQVYATQVLDALVVAAVFGLGLTYAQQLSPGRAGLASSTFGSAFGIATLVGNLIGGVSIPILGVPHLFFIPLATSCLALVTFIGLDRTATRHVESVGQATPSRPTPRRSTAT
jgi:SET family sugar efflux transporter-like MFS transporter